MLVSQRPQLEIRAAPVGIQEHPAQRRWLRRPVIRRRRLHGDGSYQNVLFMSTAGVILVDLPPTIGRNTLFTIGNVTS